jgi:hypothetical protein
MVGYFGGSGVLVEICATRGLWHVGCSSGPICRPFRDPENRVAPIARTAGPQTTGRRNEVTCYLKHARPLTGALALTLGLTLAAPPAFAVGPATAASPGPIAAAAAAKVEALPVASLAQVAPAPAAASAESGDKPFFKTTKGVVALVLTIGATAWLVQSRIDNKVSSPARQ